MFILTRILCSCINMVLNKLINIDIYCIKYFPFDHSWLMLEKIIIVILLNDPVIRFKLLKFQSTKHDVFYPSIKDQECFVEYPNN